MKKFFALLLAVMMLSIIPLVTFLMAHYRGKIDAVRAEYAAKQ